MKSGTWMIAAAPAGSVSRVDGKLNTFFPDQGSSFTVVAPMAGAPIAQEIHSPFFLLLAAGVTQPLVLYEMSTFGSVKATSQSVLPQAGQITKFNTTVINQVIDTETSAAARPIIRSAQVVMENGEATLILTGARFTYNRPEAGILNVGANIQNLLVNFDVPIRPELQFTQEELGQMIVQGLPIPKTIRITVPVDSSSSGTDTVRVKVPKGVILGLSDISVTRKTPKLDDATRVWRVDTGSDVTSPTTRITADIHTLFVANNFDKTVTAVDVTRDPANAFQPRNQILAQIPVGDQARPGPTRSVAVTPDLTRAYVTTGQGIAVIDTQTLQAIDVDPKQSGVQPIIDLEGGRPYWVVTDKAGNYLYVSDAFVGTIYVIDITPASQTFHKVVKNISVGVDAPEGLRGMDVTADGRRLYAAAPVKGGAAQFSNQSYPDGKIVVIDIDTTPGNTTLWTKLTDKTVSQEPYFVKASETDAKKVTFTNRRSDANGFGVITATNAAHTTLTVAYGALSLGSRLDNFDVNDASAITILLKGTLGPSQTKDYAFVTGWNRIQQGVPSRDPFLREALSLEEQQQSGFVLNAPVGGNIGVIEDPFGTPKLVAATAGEFLSMPDGIMLSADGRTLYASFSAQNVVRVFDVQKMHAQVTSQQNNVPNQINRRDGSFTRLQVSPLDGPGGLGVNAPLDPTIEQPGIATGRFPQGMALAESNKVTIGFGRENDAASTAILPDAEKGDTTPVFRWSVQWSDPKVRDRATSQLFLSVFKPGQGLFPTDLEGTPEFPQKDLARHRILNGVEAKHRTTQQGDFFEYDLEVEQGELRALTLGQTYYIGIKVYDGSRELATAWKEFKLEHKPATTPFSSVTIVTHGFETRLVPANDPAQPPAAFIQLAKEVAESAGGGIVAIYQKETGKWLRYDGSRSTLDELPPELGQALILVPNWMQESDIAEEGFAEAAADGIFASLMKLNNDLSGKIFGLRTAGGVSASTQSPIHFIGHSRGTVINSEIIQRIGNYVPSVGNIYMTTLDPHDGVQKSNAIPAELALQAVLSVLNPLSTGLPAIQTLLANPPVGAVHYDDLFDPDVQRWTNVTFLDNYYQTLGSNVFTLTPNGRNLNEVERIADINIPLGDSQGAIPPAGRFYSRRREQGDSGLSGTIQR